MTQKVQRLQYKVLVMGRKAKWLTSRVGFSNLTLSKGLHHSKGKENTETQLQHAPNVMLVAITDLADIINVSLQTFAQSWFDNGFRNTFNMTLVIRIVWPGSVKLCENTGRITVEFADLCEWVNEWTWPTVCGPVLLMTRVMLGHPRGEA